MLGICVGSSGVYCSTRYIQSTIKGQSASQNQSEDELYECVSWLGARLGGSQSDVAVYVREVRHPPMTRRSQGRHMYARSIACLVWGGGRCPVGAVVTSNPGETLCMHGESVSAERSQDSASGSTC